MSGVECVLRIRSDLGEGPVWHEKEAKLYWLDLHKPEIYPLDPATGRNRRGQAALHGYVGALVFRRDGAMVVLDQRGIHAIEPKSGRLKLLAKPKREMRKVRFNDAKCDRQGNLWSGVGDRKEQSPIGTFYRFSPTGKATK